MWRIQANSLTNIIPVFQKRNNSIMNKNSLILLSLEKYKDNKLLELLQNCGLWIVEWGN